MRRAFEIEAVLEGPGLALVAVDGQIARPGVGAHEGPFAPRGKARPPEATQPRGQHALLHLLPVAAGAQLGERRIAARSAIGREVLIGRHLGVEIARGAHGGDALGCCMVDMAVAHFGDGGGVAAAHAGRAQDAHLGRVHPLRQRARQRIGARQLAGKRIAHPDRQGGRRGLILAHGVEMGVEGRDLPHLGLRKAHLFGERAQVAGGEMAVGVLDEVQELDQKVAPARLVAQKRAHLGKSGIIKLAPLRRRAALAAPGFPCALPLIECHCRLRLPFCARFAPGGAARSIGLIRRSIGISYQSCARCFDHPFTPALGAMDKRRRFA